MISKYFSDVEIRDPAGDTGAHARSGDMNFVHRLDSERSQNRIARVTQRHFDWLVVDVDGATNRSRIGCGELILVLPLAWGLLNYAVCNEKRIRQSVWRNRSWLAF